MQTNRSTARRRIAALALLVVSALGACDAGDQPHDEALVIESARWQQSQAVPDFDSEPGEMTAAAELERLAEIIESHEDLRGEDVSLGEGCDGGRSTTVEYVTEGGDERSIRLEGCGGGAAADAIDDLVTEWREAR